MDRPDESFLRESARYLREVYMPRIARALESLPADDLWWRPHAGIPSFGNLLAHLEGNVRQWILSGLGDSEDRRERAREFAMRSGGGREMLAALERTVDHAADLIEALPASALGEARSIQGAQTTVMQAIYHVVEHFSWHSGQMVWIAKARAGSEHGIRFHDEEAINRARNRE